MKSRLFKPVTLLMLLAMLFGMVGIGAASADNALTLSYAVSITYLNVGTDVATLSIDFYAENSPTPIHYALNSLNAGAAASLSVGSVADVTAGFRGSAVMSSTQPLVATVVQYHNNGVGETVKIRMLSNGFGDADGSSTFLLATVQDNNTNRTDVFSVQNIESETITATIKMYDATTGLLAATASYDIPAQSTKYIQMDQNTQTGLPSGTTKFNGSATITAVMKSDGTTPGRVVVTENDYYTNKNVGASVEGVPSSKAGMTLYYATALCKNSNMRTYFAVQNSSLTTATNITITYYKTDGTVMATDGPYAIGPGQKHSVDTCTTLPVVNMVNFTGSAKVVSDTTPIVGIGRAQDGTGGTNSSYVDTYTAFLGESGGYTKLALPFVRWANSTHYDPTTDFGSWQRTYLAIQNVSGVTGVVDVKYMDKTGAVVGTDVLTIAAGAKGNSNPAKNAAWLGQNGMNAGEFGYYTDKSFGGGVLIQLDSTSNPAARFIAIARVQNPGMAEDYNAVSVP